MPSRSKVAVLLAVLTVMAQLLVSNAHPRTTELSFEDFETVSDKAYRDEAAREAHRLAYDRNLDYIRQVNAANLPFRLGVNKFADSILSDAAYTDIPALLKAAATDSEDWTAANAGLPAEWDWQARGYVTAVPNEGHCDAGYILAAVGAVESAVAISTGTLPQLAAQHILNCEVPLMGNGCVLESVLDPLYYVNSSGIPVATVVPWRGAQLPCNAEVPSSAFIAGVADVSQLTAGNDTAMMQYVQVQPVAAMVETDHACFILYAGGVLVDPNCGNTFTDATLVVGWGTDNHTSYYKARMNWGADWGEAGYVRLARGKQYIQYGGECGVLSVTGFPILPANLTAA